jgi:hypothetical protein
MFCPYCGTANNDNNFRCTKCARVIQPVAQAQPVVITTELADSAVGRWVLPVGRSGWAIAAGYAGLFALLLIPAPIALILGIGAVLDIRRHPKKRGMGRAIFAILTGALGTGLLAWLYLISIRAGG